MAPLALQRVGSDALQAAWLPRIASGQVRFATAFERLAGVTGEGAIERLGHRLSGRLGGVSDMGGATHALAVLVEEGNVLTEAEHWAKREMIVQLAGEVWR